VVEALYSFIDAARLCAGLPFLVLGILFFLAIGFTFYCQKD
jgi:hypothetical protein